MRPDEHKKKRSTQYKKKHGMSKDDQPKDSRQQKGRTDKVKVDLNLKQGKGSPGDHDKQPIARANSSSGSDNSDNDDDSQPVQKTFSRREVVSNWARYEVLPQETNASQSKGEDFLKILNSAGGTSAQFRFKEEEQWDEGEIIGTDAELLAVDLSDLSDSLQCIPLYHRLGVDKDLFSIDQMEEMESTAKLHQEQYKPKSGNKHTVCVVNVGHGDLDIETNVTDIGKKLKQTSLVDILPDKHSQKPNSDLDGCLLNKTIPDLSTADLKSSESCSGYGTGGATLCVNDKSAPGHRGPVISTHVPVNTGEKAAVTARNNLDDDLDFLLSLDNPSDVTAIGEITTKETSTAEPAAKSSVSIAKDVVETKETQNLEDWLDSVLD